MPAPDEARRAMLPDEVARAFVEVARAFVAADHLDVFHRRRHATRPVLLAMLVTAPRMTALCMRDVEDLRGGRIDDGDGTGNERNGWGALDAATAAELRAYVGKRTRGQLFLSSTGGASTGFGCSTASAAPT